MSYPIIEIDLRGSRTDLVLVLALVVYDPLYDDIWLIYDIASCTVSSIIYVSSLNIATIEQKCKAIWLYCPYSHIHNNTNTTLLLVYTTTVILPGGSLCSYSMLYTYDTIVIVYHRYSMIHSSLVVCKM